MANTIYCRNGHFNGFVPEANPSYRHVGAYHDFQERRVRDLMTRLAFCPSCGFDNLNGCPHCKTTIDNDTEYRLPRPSYCCACGKPFPWTEITLATAREYTDELELSPEDKTDLKATFPDLTADTPKTGLAISRFKKIINKVTLPAAELLKKIVFEAATEAVKRLIVG